MHKSKMVLEGRGQGQHPVLGYSLGATMAIAGGDRPGFSGTCETTLADWIQLVQMGRRDAVVNLRTPDGQEGTLWCRGGNIIDAACDGLTGEDAVYCVLGWPEGRVSVDFRDFVRRRQIHLATAALLLGAACRQDSATHLIEPSERNTPAGAHSLVPVDETIEPVWAAPSETPRGGRPRAALVFGLAGGFLIFVVAVFLVSRWEFGTDPHTTTIMARAPELLLHVDARPGNASIVLDGKQVGVGKLKMTLPRDGRSHDLLYFAPGYVSEQVAFRDVPPPHRVNLARRPDPSAPGKMAVSHIEQISKVTLIPPRATDDGRTRHRPGAAKMSGERVGTSASGAEKAARESAATLANVRIIEESRPRIQIIDERKPHIDVIE